MLLIAPTVQFKIRPVDLDRVNKAVASLPERVRKSVAAHALKSWAGPVVANVKADTPVRTGRLRRSIAAKVKRYRSGVFVVVGAKLLKKTEARLARKDKLGNDYLGAGWRVHFAEGGFHPWGGSKFVPGRRMIAKAGSLHRSRLVSVVSASVAEAIKQAGLK